MTTEATIDANSPALEAAAEYAFNLGVVVDKQQLRWIVEAFLEEEDADIGPSGEAGSPDR